MPARRSLRPDLRRPAREGISRSPTIAARTDRRASTAWRSISRRRIRQRCVRGRAAGSGGHRRGRYDPPGAGRCAVSRRGLDPEGIALGSDGIYISSEGEAKVGRRRSSRSSTSTAGSCASCRCPSATARRRAPRGVRDNLGFEASRSPPTAATSSPAPRTDSRRRARRRRRASPSLGRLLRWDLEQGGAPEEFLYRVEAVSRTPPAPTDLFRSTAWSS